MKFCLIILPLNQAYLQTATKPAKKTLIQPPSKNFNDVGTENPIYMNK